MKINCACKHEYQDSLYGVGVRIANTTPTSDKHPTFTVRCTVCAQEHELPKSQLTATDKGAA